MCQTGHKRERGGYEIQQWQRVTTRKRLFWGHWLLIQKLEHSENGSNKMFYEGHVSLSWSWFLPKKIHFIHG